MKGAHQIWGGLLAAVSILLAGPASAEPLNLQDPTPRWIEVSFEKSPSDRPAQRLATWSPPLLAWFQPGAREGWVVVAVPPDVVEQELLAEENPVPGSFSPFIWVFDARTGHVLSAELEGEVVRQIRLGFLRPRMQAHIRVAMGTERPAGFLTPRDFLGEHLHEFCESEANAACTLVPPVAYDAETGYVNAVGLVEARTKGISTTSFSALGEARFFERGSRELFAATDR